MRRLAISVLTCALVGGLGSASPPAGAQEGGCGSGTVEVRGIVRDAATGLPLQEVTSVEYEPLGAGTPADGDGTNAASRYSVCLLTDDYRFTFRADGYRVDDAASLEVEVSGDGPIIRDVHLIPQGRVLSGRVTNLAGASRVASISIWRRMPDGRWRSIDGEGNQMPSGIWSFRVPVLGRYRVNAAVDHHWARWYDDDTRLRFARTIIVNASTTFISGLDIWVPYCPGPTDDFCIPPGFTT